MASVPVLPSSPQNMPAIARIMARFDRPQLAAFITVAIDVLDALDGDGEAEDEGDGEPITWTEAEGARRNDCAPDDAEDDDEDESVEDNPLGIDPEEDMCGAGDDGCAPRWLNGNLWWGSHEEEPYSAVPIADPEAYREQKARIQRDRTYRINRTLPGGYLSFVGSTSRRLFVEPTVPNKRQIIRRKRGVPRHPRP